MVSTDPGPNLSDWGGLKLSLAEKHNELPAESKAGLSCIVPDPEPDSRWVTNGAMLPWQCAFDFIGQLLYIVYRLMREKNE